MRGVLVALVIALGGCTAILGLNKVDSIDRDNDNIPDSIDNCPDDANPDQSDFDHNGKGDACDLCTDGGADDADGDGIPDGCDGCIGVGMDADQDGIDDGCDACIGNGADADQDGIDDACDACVGNGMDVDHDMIDDACDTCVQTFMDLDHDMIDDGCDPCVAQPANVDDDGDGIENACDPCPSGPQHDEDGDLAYDACDTCKVVNNAMQNDDDGDGVGRKCDPEEGTAIVDYERMDPFTVLDPAWFAEGAAWTIANDTVRLASGVASLRWLSPLRAAFTVNTRLKFDGSATFVGNPAVGVIAFDAPSSSARFQITCYVNAAGAVIATFTDNGNNIGYAFSTATVTHSTFFDLTLALDDSKKAVTCTAVDGSNTVMVQFPYSVTGMLWFAGLKVEFADATFKYFDQIGRLP